MTDKLSILLSLLNDIDTKQKRNLNNLLLSIQIVEGLLEESKNGGN